MAGVEIGWEVRLSRICGEAFRSTVIVDLHIINSQAWLCLTNSVIESSINCWLDIMNYQVIGNVGLFPCRDFVALSGSTYCLPNWIISVTDCSCLSLVMSPKRKTSLLEHFRKKKNVYTSSTSAVLNRLSSSHFCFVLSVPVAFVLIPDFLFVASILI